MPSALTVVPHLPGPTSALHLPWIAWVAAFAVSEVLVVHIQLQRDSHSFSLTDLVFVAGLYLLEPAALITAQVAGVGLVLVLHRRQFGMKLAFNVAAVRPRRLPGHDRLRHARPRHARWPAPGTGWPRWPPSRSSTMTACACIYAVMRVSGGLADPPRAAPHARALAALRARRRGRRPAGRADRRAEPRLARSCSRCRRAC